MFNKIGKKRLPEEKVLDVNASMQGTLSFKDPVNIKINSHFEGALDLRGNLTIGPQAIVNANIKGDDIIIAGKVHGDIIARVRLKLTSTANLTGNVKASVMSIEEGACFHGNCQMFQSSKHMIVDKTASHLTPDELAQFLEVDVSIVMDWAKIGKIPALKEGGSFKFERQKIEKWLASEQIR